MNTSIKHIFKITALTSVLSIALTAHAASPSSADISMLSQLKALNNNVQVVGNRLQAAAEANARSKAGIGGGSFNLTQSQRANQAAGQGKADSASAAATSTENDILSQFQPISDNALQTSTGFQDADAISKRLVADNNQVTNLTLNLTASDTLYSNDPTVQVLSSMYKSDLPPTGFNKPTKAERHDNYFSFNSLIQPVAYATDSSEAKAAETFLTFLTQAYNNPSQDVDFQTFQTKLSEAKDAKDKASLYIQLMNNPKYQAYQLAARTSAAQRSVAVNNFQHMIAERTMVKGLGKSANLINSKGKAINDASPLQVEKYIATHRVNNPSWFANVQSASPAAVQRETLVVLAEIEAQNYQAHLDRERMIATLSAQSAMTASVQNSMMASKARSLNQDIQNMTLPSQQNSDNN